MYNSAEVYKKNLINTTSSQNLVLMLYDGAIRFLKKAVTALDEKDIPSVNQNLIRAQDIIAELMAGINFDAGEIARELYTLYEYMHYRLVQANLKKDKMAAVEITQMLGELREVWAQIVKDPPGGLEKQRKAAAGS
jgi:flagellar protein FliS